ncbi:hypothetical protein SDC9_146755 [bioreactor metagenome]|uniref:Uncharacterized protein n=1 Tax=bioreactor metagenome TaxID=1076179 RepID=A0A645EFN1_9ZZZZ|nr:hypothetical protein [Actinomycetota bacterium]
MVSQSLALIVGARVQGRAVNEQAERGAEVLARTLVLIVFAGEAAVDVTKPCPDAVLVPFEGFQVDGVGEVRGEQLVALVLESFAVLCQLGQFL